MKKYGTDYNETAQKFKLSIGAPIALLAKTIGPLSHVGEHILSPIRQDRLMLDMKRIFVETYNGMHLYLQRDEE